VRLLDRYIARSCVGGIVVAMAALAALDVFFAFVQEIPDIGRGSYGVPQALGFVLFTIPRRIYELFPTTALVGTLLSLGALAAGSELATMRSAGVPVSRIAMGAVVGAALVLVPVVLLGEFVAPAAENHALQLRVTAQSQHLTVRLRSGLWVREGDTVIHARRLLSGGRLLGLTLYEFKPDQLELNSVSRARSAEFKGDHWLLSGFHRSEIRPEGIVTGREREQRWDSLIGPELLDMLVAEPERLSVWDLERYLRYLEENRLDASRYQVALWGKLIFPVSALAMVFLGVPFAFGPLRSGGIAQRMFAGIVIGVTFLMLAQIARHAAEVWAVPPFAAAALPTLLMVLLGSWGIRRVGRT